MITKEEEEVILPKNRIAGEYYYSKFKFDNQWGEIIFKLGEFPDKNQFISLHGNYYKQESCCTSNNYTTGEIARVATPEERQWLDLCIKENKFIPKEEISKYMKEEKEYNVGDWCYVINNGTSCLENGKIYQINQIDVSYAKQHHHFDDGSGKKNNNCWLFTHEFRKATEQEIMAATGGFILPEKWCIAVTLENVKVISNWRTKGGCSNHGYCLNKVSNRDDVGYWKSDKPVDYTEITYEQFKKYVLKENAVASVDVTDDPLNILGKYFVYYDSFTEYLFQSFANGSYTILWNKGKDSATYETGNVDEYLKNGKWKLTESKPIEKWAIGTWVVAIGGNFGIFSDSNKLNIGEIFKITWNGHVDLKVDGSNYWIYKKNLTWFATKQEAERFARTLSITENDSFQVGKWYIYNNNRLMGCYQGDNFGYGFITCGEWSDKILMSDSNWKEATTQQVQEALLKEAKKRYPVGTIFRVVHNPSNICRVKSHNKYLSTLNFLSETIEIEDEDNDSEGASVYVDGIWAEIVNDYQEKPFPLATEDDFKWNVVVPKSEFKSNAEIVFGTKPELILKEDDQMIIFPNIKREKVVEIKIKLVD